jgi:hypothetical protein
MKPFFVKPKIFISHGLADQAMLETLKEFLILLNTDPILVITEPNRGLTINEKVIDPLEKCDCVIILATADNENIQKKDNYQPRANVSHEIGVAQKCQKNIIYLKQKNVDFGSNYGSQIWYEFEDNCKESIYPVLPKILSELVSFNLVSVSGKPHQELIRSSIVDQLYELIRLLGIEDQKIKANLLNLLGKSLLGKGKDLTTLEINELQEIYPEVKNTCVLDGYINKNINEAKRFMSFSLELKPDLIAYYDYLDILFNSYHLGEGEFDNNILFEIEDISLKIF